MDNELTKRYISTIVNRAIETLNKSKGTTLSLNKIHFKLSAEKPMIYLDIVNTKTRVSEVFILYKSFFDSSEADMDDAKAGIDMVHDEPSKLVLRTAYRIWRSSDLTN